MTDDTLLVTSIGTGDYNKTTYVADEGTTYETKFSSVALAEHVAIDRVLVARTKGADGYDDELERVFEERGVPCGFEEIPNVSERDDIDVVMGRLIERIRERGPDSVVLDITHGFRSLPMVFFASVIYLEALSEIELDGIYYGEFQKGVEETPLVDITHLHRLMEWYHAINTFERTGELRPAHALLDERREQLFRSKRQPDKHHRDFATFVDRLDHVSQDFDSGLPLEAGIDTQRAINALDEIDNSQFVGPEGKFLSPLRMRLAGFQVSQQTTEKTAIELDMDELHRQREIVQFYYENNRYRFSLGCARELFINRLIYQRGGGNLDNWLSDEVRRPISNELSAKDREQQEHDSVSGDDELSDAIGLWSQISQSRNGYAHSGFNEKEVSDFNDEDGKDNDTTADKAINKLCAKIDDDEYWQGVI